MTPDNPLITLIAAVIQKEYGLGPDSAPSIVRRVLEMAAAESLAGWSRDEHYPPEELRGQCRNDSAACCETATESIKRG